MVRLGAYSPSYFYVHQVKAFILTFLKNKDRANDISLDHRCIVERPLPIYPHQALPPLPSVRPRRVPARALRFSANKPTHAHKSRAHIRVGSIPRLLAVPTRHHRILLARKQRVRRHACTGTRGVDPGRGGAHALLRILARSCVFVDAVECGELDHDGCGHGRCQFSGSHPHHFSPFPPAWSHPCQIRLSLQVRVLTTTYEALLKDRTIIAAEVLHEYDEKVRSRFPLQSSMSTNSLYHQYVSPRMHPVRRDACVMTNEAEIFDYTR